MAHIIERSELDLYNTRTGQNLSLKDFRHTLPLQRATVIGQVQAAWIQVQRTAQPLGLTLDDAMTSAALARLPTDEVDGYDLFLLEAMQAHGITDVITDDGDFATVAGIRVFTANANVINQASAQGKLIIR